jgi:tRNA pseudouridine38-40 synthase
MGLWEEGTRERWAWRCPDCSDWTIPRRELLSYPEDGEFADIRARARIACEHCGALLGDDAKRALNATGRYLPHSIRVIAARVVDDAFHARFSALSRAYVYKLWLGRQLRPDLLHSAGHLFAPVGAKPDIAAMQTALASLPVGTPTDFSSLRDAQCQSKNPICTLTHARLEHTEPQLLTLHIGADHFLHHMVRNLVGTLAQVGLGQREANLMPLIAAKDRTRAGTTFSPNGLYLCHVHYPEPYTLPILA